MLRRYRLDVRYVGTGFSGWQVQPGRRTVQGELERVLAGVGERARPTGAGRTDAGVHALRNVAHVDLLRSWDGRELANALHSLASEDIAILDARGVDPGFHARHGAALRTYAYAVAEEFDPFFAARRWTARAPDEDWIARELSSLPEEGDYASFARSGADDRGTVCVGVRAGWQVRERGGIFWFEARRFLYGMVRALVGTVIVGAKRGEAPGYVARVLAAGRREAAGEAAPPGGLYLLGVRYPGEAAAAADLDAVARAAGLGPAGPDAATRRQ